MPHWKSLQGKEYLGSWDFEEGEEKVVTITAYDSETIKNPLKDDDKNNKPKVVLSFKECKKCVMNTTNCETLTALFKSADVKDWVGKRIILHTEKVRAFGKMVDGIRVMNKLPKTNISVRIAGKRSKRSAIKPIMRSPKGQRNGTAWKSAGLAPRKGWLSDGTKTFILFPFQTL